jgi:hypothetical protein
MYLDGSCIRCVRECVNCQYAKGVAPRFFNSDAGLVCAVGSASSKTFCAVLCHIRHYFKYSKNVSLKLGPVFHYY